METSAQVETCSRGEFQAKWIEGEHAAIPLGETSTLAKKSNKTNHHICIENSCVVAKIDHYHRRKFREAIEIGKHPNNFNHDDDWKISDNWIPTLNSKSNLS